MKVGTSMPFARLHRKTAGGCKRPAPPAHDERWLERLEPLHERRQAFAGARTGEGFARGQHMTIQPILRHVDADKDLFHDPSL